MNTIKGLKLASLLALVFAIGYILMHMPMQVLKITAVTTAEEFNISGTTDIYWIGHMDAGENHTAVLKFMAVKDSSDELFTSHGTGQYVYLGCNELTAECEFISFGKFMHIKLTLNAADTDLKLEDGTPFDITRYSLKPVLTIEE